MDIYRPDGKHQKNLIKVNPYWKIEISIKLKDMNIINFSKVMTKIVFQFHRNGSYVFESNKKKYEVSNLATHTAS